MKKLALTLLLFTSLASYSQGVGLGLTLNNIIPIDLGLYPTEATALTVPEGKFWIIRQVNNERLYGLYFKPKDINSNYSVDGYLYLSNTNLGFKDYYTNIFTPGAKIYSRLKDGYDDYDAIYQIYEFNAPNTQTGTLALNEVKAIDNKLQLFPNPTNSRLSLNSEKDYNIEVFDLTGRKIMEAQGNNLDMSNLSKATYIVKAFDKASKETYSYKVIRN